MRFRYFIFSFFLIIFSNSVFAQKLHFSIVGLGNIPVGNYSNQKISYSRDAQNKLTSLSIDGGYAKFGYGGALSVGYDFKKPKGLGIYFDTYLITNSLETSVFDELLSQIADTLITGVSSDYAGLHTNISLMVGPRYEFNISKSIKLFLKGQAGINFHTMSDLEYTTEGTTVKDKFSTNKGSTYSLGFVAGMVPAKNLEVSLRLIYTGKPKTVISYSGLYESRNIPFNVNVMVIALAAGFVF
jgi:hypothetical protein